MKVVPRRPSKRGSISHARKLSMTDFGNDDDDSTHASPRPKRRGRMSLCEPPKGVVFRVAAARSRNLTVVSSVDSFRQMTDAMKKSGVKLLAIDWDLTMVSCHTRSQWYGTAEELGRHVRPVFRKLVRAAMGSGLKVTIVSFSGQHSLIRGAVASAFPCLDTDEIVLRCSDKKWGVSEKHLQQIFPAAKISSPGKLTHLCSAAQQLCLADKENGLHIKPQDIVLIDDDLQNVENAQHNKVTAVLMNPDKPDHFLLTLGERYLDSEN